MLKNVVKTSFRFLTKNRYYTLINVLGLSLGLGTSVLIFIYITDELSFDKFHTDYENIYRVQERYEWDDYKQGWATCDGSMAPRIARGPVDSLSVCRLMTYFNPPFLYANARSANSGQVIFADSGFLDVFSFPMVTVPRQAKLNHPNDLMISEKIAMQLFGNTDVTGQKIEADGALFVVTGVFKEIPSQSHLNFDVVFSMELLRKSFPEADSTGPIAFYTYFRSPNERSTNELRNYLIEYQSKRLDHILAQEADSTMSCDKIKADILFIPINDIHLKSHAEKEYQTNGNYDYIFIYFTIALFILLLASINYINLATASSIIRAREIGVRKILGAQKKNIFFHFISEAFILVLASTITALVFVELSFPTFNSFVGKSLSINMIWSFEIMTFIVITVVVLTIFSGFYPSLFMSTFSPLSVLSNRLNAQKNNKLNLILRRILVISQFSIAVFLSIASIVVAQQLRFISTQDLGFNRDHVIVIPLHGENSLQHLHELKKDFIQTPGILSVTGSSNIPGERFGYYGIYLPSLEQKDDSAAQSPKTDPYLGIRMLCVDHDFLSSFGFEIAEGRTFNLDIWSDSNAFILNEAAVKKYQIDRPIGKDVIFNYAVKQPKKGKIIGVVKDFHYASLHSEVEPLMIQIFPPFFRYVILKVETGSPTTLIAEIERKWHKHLPHAPFRYNYLDQTYDEIYSADNRLGRIFYFFTVVALFLAALGLYGLVAFISEQRKAEIGIRKILGASIGRLMFTMSREFVLLIFISNVIAWIPAWFFIKSWLSDFVFRIEPSIWPFVYTSFISLFIGLITISIKTWLTSKSNPADILSNQ